MAGIDKTYISDYKTFDKIRNWALKQEFVLKNGQIIKLKNYLYYPDITEKDWNKHEAAYHQKHPNEIFDVVLWNTPIYVDIWLIRNCPFEEIQERLREQYNGGWSKTEFTDHNYPGLYEQIKDETSIYDTYQRDGLGWNAKVKFRTYCGSSIRDKKCLYYIEVNPFWIGGKRTQYPETPWYNETDDMWYWNKEAMPWTSNVLMIHGYLSKKKIVRMIKRWNLPKGSIVQFRCTYKRWTVHEFYCTVE